MNEHRHTDNIVVSEARTLSHTTAAKARLLSWADDHDARESKARSSTGAVIARGALTVLGGMVLLRILIPRRRSASRSWTKSAGARLINWAVVARAGAWLLPHVVRAVRNHPKRPVLG